MVIAVVVVVLALWTTLHNARRPSLNRMPPADRHALFVRVTANAKALCASGEPGLQADCQSQLEFLADFPECDQSCQKLIATYRPAATK